MKRALIPNDPALIKSLIDQNILVYDADADCSHFTIRLIQLAEYIINHPHTHEVFKKFDNGGYSNLGRIIVDSKNNDMTINYILGNSNFKTTIVDEMVDLEATYKSMEGSLQGGDSCLGIFKFDNGANLVFSY